MLAQVRDAIRLRHYSIRTEDTYLHWIKRFLLFHGARHPAEMGAAEIGQFLSMLAVDQHVSATTQNQALNALVFLYRHVLDLPPGAIANLVRAKQPQRLPVVLQKHEVTVLLNKLEGAHWLMGHLLYGAGLRLMECLRLRVKDVDFSANQILVREGKGNKDRITMLPNVVKAPLLEHLAQTRELHQRDLSRSLGSVYLPYALARKYPTAPKEWGWQWVFPARADFSRPTLWRLSSSPSTRECPSTRCARGGPTRGSQQTCRTPHTAPLLCHPSPRRGIRHSHHPRITRAQGREYNHDLHPRAESWRERRH